MPDGTTRNVQAKELLQLAQFGAMKVEEIQNKSDKDEPEVKDEELTSEERLKKAEEKLAQMEQKEKQKEAVNEINTALVTARRDHDKTKESEKLHNLISLVTLAKVNINPRLDYKTTYKESLADVLEYVNENVESEKEKGRANNKVRNSMMGVQRGSDSPALDKDKKFTPDDIRSNASRRALQEFLETVRGD